MKQNAFGADYIKQHNIYLHYHLFKKQFDFEGFKFVLYESKCKLRKLLQE